jgi:hypothetical protein
MNNREQYRADRVDRVLVFGDENAADFAAGGKAAESFTRLRAIQAALGQARVGQQVPTGRTALEVLFDALRMDLQNLTRTARTIAQEQPGFADAFRLPAPPTDGTLLTTADAFVDRLAAKAEDDDATKIRKTAMTAAFVAHELPADFVTHLQADAQAIRAEQHEREKDRASGVGSTAIIGPLLQEASEIVTTLDAVMHNKYTRVPDKLRAWKSASHVERAAQREKKPEPPTPTPPALPTNP